MEQAFESEELMKKQVWYEIKPVNGAPYEGPRRLDTLAEARDVVRSARKINPSLKLAIDSITMIVKPIKAM